MGEHHSARQHNWSDTYTFGAARIHHPASVDEVRRLVAHAAKARAIGARHSFNGIADSPGDLIDLAGLEPRVDIDSRARTATVPAAMNYGALAAFLQARGWALHNMGSLPHISVAGATATGTHGSGDRNGNLSTAVAGLELVTATGDLVELRRGHADFDGMVVGLGAFGVVTRLTLDIQPTFDLRQDAFVDLPWAAALSNLDAIMSSAYSVSMMTSWSGETIGRLWVKTRIGDEAPPVTALHLGAAATAHASANTSNVASERLTAFGDAGPWSERLPHFRAGADLDPAQIQSEYMVPRSNAVAALKLLRAMGERIDAHLQLTEIRSMAGDTLWLSPSEGHDTVALHFTWRREPEPVSAITSEIEDQLIPLGARPHWGKLMHARADVLAGLYPRLPAFRDLARAYDPTGKFRNEFLDNHVFGAGTHPA